jgi:opacity protein-like surface antigen
MKRFIFAALAAAISTHAQAAPDSDQPISDASAAPSVTTWTPLQASNFLQELTRA